MKHNDNKLPDTLKQLSNMSNPQRFYTVGDGRYTALFKRTLKRVPGRGASSTALTPEHWVGTLYIYDSKAHEQSPVFTINDKGILGLHGTKPAVVEQLAVIDNVVSKVMRLAFTMEGMK